MKFGFLIHPRSMLELRVMFPPYGVPFYPACTKESLKSLCIKKKVVKDHFTLKKIVSANGISCSGKVYCVYLAPDQFLDNQSLALELMKEASMNLKDWGAQIIGLGGLTGVVGSRGKELSEQVSVPVTSGNSFTVYSSIKVLEKIVRILGINLCEQKVTIIGFPGSISLAISQILAQKGVNLILVSKRETSFLKQFLSSIKETTSGNVEVTNSIQEGLQRSKIIFTATSTGRIIDPDALLKGSIVIDIAQPRDVIEKHKKRDNVLIVDGGIVTLPRNGNKQYKIFDWRGNDIPGCLGETIVLALENRYESFSIGRRLSIEKIEEIGKLGEKHGFVTDNFRSFRKPIKECVIENVKRDFINN